MTASRVATPCHEMAQIFHALQDTLHAPPSPGRVNGISYSRRQSPSNRSKQVKYHTQCLHSNEDAGDSLCLAKKSAVLLMY